MTPKAEEESRVAMKLAIEHIEWMANTVHQAHHGHDYRAPWRECEKGVCLSTIPLLAQLREIWGITK